MFPSRVNLKAFDTRLRTIFSHISRSTHAASASGGQSTSSAIPARPHAERKLLVSSAVKAARSVGSYDACVRPASMRAKSSSVLTSLSRRCPFRCATSRSGRFAAATSTGGTTGKRWGRVGDSPLIGAGTYASDRGAAISGTGEGEYFIRLAVAHRISALMEYEGMALQVACDQVVLDNLTSLGGHGGVIAASPAGEMAWSFNTSGMYRAKVGADAPLDVAIYGDEA